MSGFRFALAMALVVGALLPASCQAPGLSSHTPNGSPIRVVAAETFLADIAQNVAGERLVVESLIPGGVDPHAFEPTPQDVARVAESQVLIINGAGFEEWLDELLDHAGGERLVIEASEGLTARVPQAGESPPSGHDESDPHFWLDPNLVVTYVTNICAGLSQADPAGSQVYGENAEAYIAQLDELDAWIQEQVAQIPLERRLLVTNHESFGYFADRYGFQIVGTLLPSVSSSASPSAQQMVDLVERIRQSGAPAIFLETGANPQLAEQIAQETGVKVVTGLYTHSVSDPTGEAPTYLDMLRFNVGTISEALR